MNPSSPYAARPWLEHYDYWVRPHLTYPRRALTEILDTAAVDLPDRPATAFLGAELTFQQIKDRSDPFAAALAGLGIAKGDRVGIMLPNCPQYIVAAFAVLRLGAIIVNVNPTYTAREVLTVANDSAMRVLITLDRLARLSVRRRRASTAPWRLPICWPARATPTYLESRSMPTMWRCCSTREGRPARRKARC